MNNQLTQGPVVQRTAFGPIRPNQLVTGGVFQPSSQACIIDLIPPVFSGIGVLTVGSLGQLQAVWPVAVDPTGPISYEVYVSSNPLTLFNTVNIALVTRSLNADIFALSDGSLLQTGVNYYVGVRAVDGVGNRDSNTAQLNRTTPGITGATNAQITGVFAVDLNNQFIGNFWVTDNDGVVSSPLRLGTASYVIYDRFGNLVIGMSQSGIVADSEGYFEIAPVASVLDLDNNFYTAKVNVLLDGVNIIYNLPITYASAGPAYEPRAVFSINAANQLEGTIWIIKNGLKVDLANLGVASYAVRNSAGALVGISQSGILPDANGLYKATPVLATAISDFQHYTIDLTVVADGAVRDGRVAIVAGEL
jgi:hypothetical protein